MKHLNLKLAGVITFSLLSISAFSQFDWHQGGNGLTPPPASVAIPANQLLGTTANQLPSSTLEINTTTTYLWLVSLSNAATKMLTILQKAI